MKGDDEGEANLLGEFYVLKGIMDQRPPLQGVHDALWMGKIPNINKVREEMDHKIFFDYFADPLL